MPFDQDISPVFSGLSACFAQAGLSFSTKNEFVALLDSRIGFFCLHAADEYET